MSCHDSRNKSRGRCVSEVHGLGTDRHANAVARVKMILGSHLQLPGARLYDSRFVRPLQHAARIEVANANEPRRRRTHGMGKNPSSIAVLNHASVHQ